MKVSPCSDQHTRSSEAGDETISKSLMRKGATLSSSGETEESEPQGSSIAATSAAWRSMGPFMFRL